MVLDPLPVAVCAVDRGGKVILWNEGAERVTGYLRQEVLGRLCTEAFLEQADQDNNQLDGNAHPLDARRTLPGCARLPPEKVRGIRGHASSHGAAALTQRANAGSSGTV